MTTDEIDNLEAGVEIDRMVAEACEVRLDHSGLVIPQLTDCKEVQFSPHRRSFRPSTCWDDAMEALDRVVGSDDGRFPADKAYLEADKNGWVVDLHKITVWREGDETNDWMDTPIASRVVAYAKAPTGPLAICRAILKAHASFADRE